jgi:aubergine-like protein
MSRAVQRTKVKSNYFNFTCDNPIFKYKVETEPVVPSNQVGLLYRILSKLRDTLNNLLSPYQPFNFMIYSPSHIDETTFTAEHDNVSYTVKLVPTGMLEVSGTEKESLVFMGRFFKVLQGNLKLKQVGRKYFNDKAPEEFSQWKLTVWPGYQSSLNQYKDHILINVDSCFKVLRETTVYEFLDDLMTKFQGNQERVKEEMIGMTVMTRYNNQMYRIDDIDFQLNPKCTFPVKEGGEISYAEYYEKKYNKKLNYPKQPLLIHKKKKDGTTIHLVPELCVLTGQSDEMRANFQLQKDLNRIIKPNPQKRLEESQKLIELIKNNPKTSELLKKWSISIAMDPLSVDAFKIDAGNIIMGRNNTFSLENTPDFDRKIQSEMLDQVKIRKIGVFCSSRDKEACRTFMETLKKCVETFNYPMDLPKEFFVDGKGFDAWEEQFSKVLDPSVQAVILLLPGRKKAAPFYDECKNFLLTRCPIPSQVVLIPTITAGKNLRSIINKVLIQICAKVGGTPWSVTDFPFVDVPTMVVGIDVFHKTAMKKDSLLAFCGTVNKHLSRYWSTIDIHAPGEEIGKGMQNAVRKCLLAFRETNAGRYPARIVVFRDGVSDSQRKTLEEIEVKAFLRAFDELVASHELKEKPEMIFVCVNKRMTAKFFSGDNLHKDGLSNPDQGTVVSEEITTGKDFYLISQKTNQGSATPTHYFILSYYTNEDGKYVEKTEKIPEDIMQKIQVFTYKLCYMYYNWSGSIKVPAPIQYAHKLSNLIGDRWRPNNQMIPHHAFEDYKSLYFI